jgi:CRP/FNR family transcriptional regulator, cyclic AMP receptor protein
VVGHWGMADHLRRGEFGVRRGRRDLTSGAVARPRARAMVVRGPPVRHRSRETPHGTRTGRILERFVLSHNRSGKRLNDDNAHDPASLPRVAPPPGAHSAAEPDERDRLRELLVRALPDVTTETIETLVETARLRSVGSGDVVIRQGETLPFTLVIQGYAAIRRTTTDARELVLGIARPGSLVGHRGVAGRAASQDLVAITPSDVALWSGTQVRSLVRTDPGLALSVIDAMGRLWGKNIEQVEGFIHQEARGRVLRVLATYADLFFSEPPVLPRTLLPGLVGTSREMTGRVLRSLEAEGVVSRVGRRGLRLLAPAALEQAAEPTDTAS